MATIIALLLLGYLIKEYHYAQPTLNLERFSLTNDYCESTGNTMPPLSTRGMLLPYPRYEWSYSPKQWLCNSNKGVVYRPFNGRDNLNHTYNPFNLQIKHHLYGIMPETQMFHMKNRMALQPSDVYSSEPLYISTF